MTVHNFSNSLLASRIYYPEAIVWLEQNIDGYIDVMENITNSDDGGVDLEVITTAGTFTVDIKGADGDSRQRYWDRTGGLPHFPIETWSVVGRKIGWTFHSGCDAVLYVVKWSTQPTAIYWFPDYQLLRYTACLYFDKYLKTYGEILQRSERHQSKAIFVPIDIFLDDMNKLADIKTYHRSVNSSNQK